METGILRTPAQGTVSSPRSVEAALADLIEGQGTARAIAGGTWVMRAHTWGEALPLHLVALNRIEELQEIDLGPDSCRIGAMATHDRLAQRIPRAAADLRALALAAGRSANPGVRRLATLGGNLCCAGFPAADLIPALMCLDAQVGVACPEGRRELGLDAFMDMRRQSAPFLVTHVSFPRNARVASHARTPERDYPVCIVSLSAALDPAGRIADLRLAVGAVERDARRWPRFERDALGQLPEPAAMGALAQGFLDDFTPISALDGPGWYRRQVLPALVRRAFQQIEQRRPGNDA